MALAPTPVRKGVRAGCDCDPCPAGEALMSKASPPDAEYDVVVVGAGPAGLSAALILGRCARRVLICDDGTPRSWAAHQVHGFLTRDGEGQDHFRALGRRQLR
jgi:threonine dehydrogenase-like Zn-dependent dehydrogenase